MTGGIILPGSSNPPRATGIGGRRIAVTADRAVTAADKGAILDCAGTIVLTLDAAADLGDGFTMLPYCTSGAVTVTADGAEVIEWPDGTSASSKALTPSQGVLLLCDGTGIKAVLDAGLGATVAALAAETAARIAADAALSSAITMEATTRATDDGTLATAITAEATARAAADGIGIVRSWMGF